MADDRLGRLEDSCEDMNAERMHNSQYRGCCRVTAQRFGVMITERLGTEIKSDSQNVDERTKLSGIKQPPDHTKLKGNENINKRLKSKSTCSRDKALGI